MKQLLKHIFILWIKHLFVEQACCHKVELFLTVFAVCVCMCTHVYVCMYMCTLAQIYRTFGH